MNRFVKYIVILLFFCSVFQTIEGQIYDFKNFDSEAGITNTTILSIDQLDNGEIWLGTNEGGINSFDGNTFKTITQENGLVDNVIYDFMHDDKGNVWISTNNGVSVYDGKKFDSIPFADTLVHTRIFKTFIDSKNTTWFCTGEGLATLVNGEMVKYQSGNDKLDKSPIIYGGEDQLGNIWLGSMGESAFKIEPSGEVTQMQSGKSMKYTFFIFHPDAQTTWFLTYKGLFELKRGIITEKVFESFKNFKSTYFHHCLKDVNGNFWLATKKRGVLKVRGDKEKLFNTSNGLIDNNCWRVFQDREHNIWIGGYEKGVSILPSETFELTNTQFGLPEDNVQSLFTDSKKNLWVGTAKGIYKDDGVEPITIIDPKRMAKNDIRAIGEDHLGNIHVVMKSGVKIIGPNKTEIINLNNDDEMFKGWCVFVDGEEVIYGGVQGLGIRKGKYIEIINDSIRFSSTPVYDIEKDNSGVYWFATDRGLISYDGVSTTYFGENDGIATGKMRSIVKDVNGDLWIGSSEGIYVYTKGKFIHISEDNGLTSNTIYSLCFDMHQQLWVGQPNGVDRLVLEGHAIKEVRHYDAGKGFMANYCHNNAITLDAKGRVLIGTDKGLLTYNQEFDKFNSMESVTVINDVKLFSQPTDWSTFSDTLDERGYPVDIELSYNQNYFSFDFNGICHRNPLAVQYQYMLEGLDKDWILTKAKRNAAYSNLKPGHYTFKVMSSNDEGIWNKEPVIFSFTILPPFWQTWWFYSLCFLAFVFAIYSYLKIKASNKKISASNQQIVQQNKIIEEKNHEIVDSINYAKRIQEAILPKNEIKEEIPGCFVFYQPKDIVSGDFYWCKQVEDNYLLAAVDCTGHGVPGGFVSMVGYSGLNRAVNEYRLRKPADILEKLAEFVVESFDKDGDEDGVKDGMDAALCSIDMKTKVVEFSGANNPLYIVRENGTDVVDPENQALKVNQFQNLYEIKGDRRPVGSSENKTHFTNHRIQLEKGDCIYFFTDGFPDQFGGPKGKKYMYKSFKRLLISLADQPVEIQREKIGQEFDSWRKSYEQVDDICIIGVKV